MAGTVLRERERLKAQSITIPMKKKHGRHLKKPDGSIKNYQTSCNSKGTCSGNGRRGRSPKSTKM